eukprot:30899-Pelagococcus_subviridis.AAC.26
MKTTRTRQRADAHHDPRGEQRGDDQLGEPRGVRDDHRHRDEEHRHEQPQARRRGVFEHGHEREPAAAVRRLSVKIRPRVEEEDVSGM